MIYNYTKCESVIAKIMADLDSSEVRQRTSDIREWIFEAVDKIGAPMQYISKESGDGEVPVFKIEGNQIPIPVDLAVLDGVAYSVGPKGPWIPMSKSTSIFKQPKRSAWFHDDRIQVGPPPHDPENKAIEDETGVIFKHGPMGQKMITSQSQFYDVNTSKYLNRMFGKERIDRVPEYFIKPGWIVTNRRKGFVKLAYKAIATDERGYPLIPDLTSYQEAIYWYVVMKLTFPKFMNNQLGGTSKFAQKYATQTYFYTQQQWNFYRNQAYAEAMMPTADDMRNIKKEWNRLIPEFESDETFFKDLNKQERTYNDYYYGY